MTWKQIETAKEVRKWITQIVLPTTAAVAAAVISIPEYRQAAIDLGNHIKRKIEDKKNQKERP